MLRMVSVIIPVYNAEHFLQRCMDSVLRQSYVQTEIVLVDDGSTDGSAHLCDEYALQDDRVRVIHQQNQGASIARHNGLKQSQGEFVTFVDSDDWVETDYISKLYALIEKYQVSISACQVRKVVAGQPTPLVSTTPETSLLEHDELMLRFLSYEFWGFYGKLYRRSVLLNGITFPKATISEDYYVMAQLFLKERKMAVMSEPLYSYEYHENSLSHQKLSKRAFEEFDNVKKVYELIDKETPQYADYAFANAIGSCMKLHLLYHSCQKDNGCLEDYYELHHYLRSHIPDILQSKQMKVKEKIVAVGLSVFPMTTVKLLNLKQQSF